MAASSGSSGATGASGASQRTPASASPSVELRWLRRSRDEIVLQQKSGEDWQDVPTAQPEAETAPTPAAEAEAKPE